MRYAVVCAIARNETPTILCWVKYHLAVGFEHILIYDNGNHPPLSCLLRDYCDAGLVSVFPFPGRKSPQLSAYFHCLETFRGQARWIAFLDVDEYLVPLIHADVRDLLDEYRDCAALAVHWRVFGSNGHVRRPDLPVMQAYTRMLHDSDHIKSIVDPAKTLKPLSPHHFAYREGDCCVNEDRFPVPGAFSYPTLKRVQLNHYYYRSQQDYADKIDRGLATPVKNVSGYEWQPFFDQARIEGREDRAAGRFQPLYELLGRLPAKEWAERALEHWRRPLAETLGELAGLAARGEFAAAERLFDVTRRYHADVSLYVLGARLACLMDDPGKALALLRQMVLHNGIHPRQKGPLYVALADLYVRQGNAQAAEAARAFAERLSKM